jgi:DNA primase
MWKKTDAAIEYYQQLCAEQEWIEELERLRQVNFYDLTSIPWA